LKLSKYSIGIGDRFGYEGKAQLSALMKAAKQGVHITPVWNKSFREHKIIGSTPADTRRAADQAVKVVGWNSDYFVDADHIGEKTVQDFLGYCDYFTVDVAEEIGKQVDEKDVAEYLEYCERFMKPFEIPGITEKITVTREEIEKMARQYLAAVLSLEKLYRRFQSELNTPFVLELSIDETEKAQKPIDLFFILAAVAWKNVPLDTIAPKFTGRFDKGVDYVGDVQQFALEFEQDILFIQYAKKEFNFSPSLKISVHSGSDKFSIYPVISGLIRKYHVGMHLKTAGTTWLEELIGLAMTGGSGLSVAKEIYTQAFERFDELTGPYATVLDIQRDQLPKPAEVDTWTSQQYSEALRHNQTHEYYNRHFRQLLHVGYKVAAEMGSEFCNALVKYRDVIAANVKDNLFDRHISALFL